MYKFTFIFPLNFHSIWFFLNKGRLLRIEKNYLDINWPSNGESQELVAQQIQSVKKVWLYSFKPNDTVIITNYQKIYWTPSERMKNTQTRWCCNFSAAPKAVLWILGVCFVAAILFRHRKNFLVRISSRSPKRRQ